MYKRQLFVCLLVLRFRFLHTAVLYQPPAISSSDPSSHISFISLCLTKLLNYQQKPSTTNYINSRSPIHFPFTREHLPISANILCAISLFLFVISSLHPPPYSHLKCSSMFAFSDHFSKLYTAISFIVRRG